VPNAHDILFVFDLHIDVPADIMDSRSIHSTRLFTVPYFFVRSPGSSAHRYGRYRSLGALVTD